MDDSTNSLSPTEGLVAMPAESSYNLARRKDGRQVIKYTQYTWLPTRYFNVQLEYLLKL